MRGYIVACITLVCLAGIFHMLFIMFDYAYYNPDSGAFIMLPEVMNETMTPEYQNITYNQTIMYREAFGMGRFAVMGLCVVTFFIGIFDTYAIRRNGGG